MMYAKGESLYIHFHQLNSLNNWTAPSFMEQGHDKTMEFVKYMDVPGVVGAMNAMVCPNVA